MDGQIINWIRAELIEVKFVRQFAVLGSSQ